MKNLYIFFIALGTVKAALCAEISSGVNDAEPKQETSTKKEKYEDALAVFRNRLNAKKQQKPEISVNLHKNEARSKPIDVNNTQDLIDTEKKEIVALKRKNAILYNQKHFKRGDYLMPKIKTLEKEQEKLIEQGNAGDKARISQIKDEIKELKTRMKELNSSAPRYTIQTNKPLGAMTEDEAMRKKYNENLERDRKKNERQIAIHQETIEALEAEQSL